MNNFFNKQKNNDFFNGKQQQADFFETKQVNGVYETRGEGMSLSKFFGRIYALVAMGIGLSAIISMMSLYLFPENVRALIFNPSIMIMMCIAELILVMVLSAKSLKDAPSSLPLFFVFSALNGITLSVTLALFTPGVVTLAFFITAGMFFVMSWYGTHTKRDLTGLGKACMAGLIGIFLTSIISMFFAMFAPNFINGMTILISLASILIFSCLIAYENNRIADYYRHLNGNIPQGIVVQVGLQLYLDFLNLFISILRILGLFSSRD
ncbi:MAG: Bax inhibitor-1/YccA family protein [Streptococcaceae bacterium]|jgi:FtsH-binding integral membrane protein|nr:Bax inhibitor-1/YccA family protein [Streptococcaceae bacterium]